MVDIEGYIYIYVYINIMFKQKKKNPRRDYNIITLNF